MAAALAAGAPVEAGLARAFIEALRAEYVQGVECGVGQLYERSRVPQRLQSLLDPFEDRVRGSRDRARAIADLEAMWGSGPPAPAAAAEVEGVVAELRAALSAPTDLPARAAVLQGLQARDLEVARKALSVAPCFGLAGGPELREAEARLRAARQLPVDWDLAVYARGRALQGSGGGRQGSTVVAFQRQPPQVVQEVQELFDATYRKVYTRDRRGAPVPDRFLVREVLRVLNDQVWREYTACREATRARMRGSRAAPVPGGAQTSKCLADRGGATALPALDAEVAETWLFHGTTAEAARAIAEDDFRLDLSGTSAGSLYGRGIYLAENATKADEYGEGASGAAAEERPRGQEAVRPPGPPPPLVRESYLLLCRTLLGRVHYTDEDYPDPEALRRSCRSGEFESVLGDRVKRRGTFREFVVYHDDFVYPEFVVRYERLFFHDRFAEMYTAMLERRRQNAFTGPTREEQRVLESMWNVYAMPNMGKINKWQLLDLLTAIKQPPQNEGEDLDATFREWDAKKDGWLDLEEFLQEMSQRVRDGIGLYG